jgi:hypothetical protein
MEAIARPLNLETDAMARPFQFLIAVAAVSVSVPLAVNFTHVSEPEVPVELPPV